MFPEHEPHDAIPSTAEIAGHPLHPALVPLPIGALACALVSDVLFARTGDESWAKTSRFLVAAGLAGGAVSAPFGLIDFLTQPQIRSHGIAWGHAIGNVTALGLTAANLSGRLGDPKAGARGNGLALSVGTVSILAVTSWLGGEMAHRSRIGIRQEAGAAGPEERPGAPQRPRLREPVGMPVGVMEKSEQAAAATRGRSGGEDVRGEVGLPVGQRSGGLGPT